MLRDGPARVAVDVSLLLNAEAALDLSPKSKFMCIGTVEKRVRPVRGPSPPHARHPPSSPSTHAQHHAERTATTELVPLVIRALFVKQVDPLDLRVWARAARALAAPSPDL